MRVVYPQGFMFSVRKSLKVTDYGKRHLKKTGGYDEGDISITTKTATA